jgi:hypothetical protein
MNFSHIEFCETREEYLIVTFNILSLSWVRVFKFL